MNSFKEFLIEGYHNFHEDDHHQKHKHAEQVFDMLQKAYEPIGGVHGNGFSSPEDMVNNVHMWKLHKKGDTILGAMLYKKTPYGRKMVAFASNGTPEGKSATGKMLSDEYTQQRSHAELSGPALSTLKKNIHITQHSKSFEEAQKYHEKRGDKIRPADEDDPEVKRHPELKDHLYQRQIGGVWHTKVLIGPLNKDSDRKETKKAE